MRGGWAVVVNDILGIRLAKKLDDLYNILSNCFFLICSFFTERTSLNIVPAYLCSLIHFSWKGTVMMQHGLWRPYKDPCPLNPDPSRPPLRPPLARPAVCASGSEDSRKWGGRATPPWARPRAERSRSVLRPRWAESRLSPACHCHLARVPGSLPVPFKALCPPRATARPGVPAVPGSRSRRRTSVPLVSAWNASGWGRTFFLSIAPLYIECRHSYSRGSNCFPL